MINQFKKLYVWKGTITALTTGEFLWLDGDNTQELDFVENVVYKCKLSSLTKFTDNSNFQMHQIGQYFQIFKNSINGYSVRNENSLIGDMGASESPYLALDPDDNSNSGVVFYSEIISNKLRLECTTNPLTKDAEIKFIITVEDIYNPFAL